MRSPRKWKYLQSVVAIVFIASDRPANFQQVVSNPRSYHHKKVTVIAMADVGGDRFILYQPPKAKSVSGFAREIYVDMQIEGPNYDGFNGKLVKVSGVIDAYHHGLAAYACELMAHRVQLLNKCGNAEHQSGVASVDAKIEEILKNPRVYDHRRVSVTGFAHVFGDAFALYENAQAASKREVTYGLFVRQRFDTPDYDGFDNRWISLTGIVDASEHGVGFFPCGIEVERLRTAAKLATTSDKSRTK